MSEQMDIEMKKQAEQDQKELEKLRNHVASPEEKALEHKVEEQRITLVDGKDTEYEFIILDELQVNGKQYLALVSCDEKDEKSSGNDMGGDMDDITVVEKHGDAPNMSLSAVTDTEELLAVSMELEKKYGHLTNVKEDIV